jgi:hypothetical protein
LAIGASNEHDNSLPPVGEESGRVALMIKETVMDDCKVSPFLRCVSKGEADVVAQVKGVENRG